jgi:transposase InsO family protein
MSDNGNPYRSRLVRAELEPVGARHILAPPYTPRWNGKVERFFQTLKREWAYAHSWPASARRSRALASFLRYYNRQPPTAHWDTGPRSAAFTTSMGKTPSAVSRAAPLRIRGS